MEYVCARCGERHDSLPFGYHAPPDLEDDPTSEDGFKRTVDVWEIEGREQEPPLFGWLSTELPLYPVSTLGLATDVRTRPVGERPLIALHPTDHPLAIEQRAGITPARVIQISASVLHDADPPR